MEKLKGVPVEAGVKRLITQRTACGGRALTAEGSTPGAIPLKPDRHHQTIFDKRFDDCLAWLTCALNESETFIGKASEGEVVVRYLEPSVTPHMEVSGSPVG